MKYSRMRHVFRDEIGIPFPEYSRFAADRQAHFSFEDHSELGFVGVLGHFPDRLDLKKKPSADRGLEKSSLEGR